MGVIATNVASLRAANASLVAGKAQSMAMERLSTGKRINSAKDDAAGLAIASSMTAQIRGMAQSVRNAQDGISLVQTAEGALDEMTNIYQRIRELQVQKENQTYSTNDRANIVAEQEALTNQAAKIITGGRFNGTGLFMGSPASIDIQAGANADDKLTVTLVNVDHTSYLGGVMAGGSFRTTASIADIDTVLERLATTRAGYGAMQNRLESAISNLTANLANLSDARSRIEDADFSAETTGLARAQILTQASTAMLAQANQSQQGVLRLLQ